ncbi:MAG: DUF3108 domain-containing protein, partial [Desulfosarcina sp.]
MVYRWSRPAFWAVAAGILGGVFLAGLAGSADTPASIGAFGPGERLIFELKWTIIPAGEAVLEVLPAETSPAGAIGAYHFLLTARSNAFVDAFFRVRDRIDAWSDSDMQRSLRYRQEQLEGNTRRDVTVTFDWETMTARYHNRGHAREPIPIADGTLDPLSVFYWSRTTDLAVGVRIERPVTDGKKLILGYADVVRRERVTVPAGTFDTFLIEPDLEQVGGVFEKSPEARIQVWVTADQRKVPVKLKSRVIVGSFSGELIHLE